MSLTITLLLLGLGAGAAIALTALGLVLMYRSTGVLNFATGAVGMASSYVFWDLTREQGWPALTAGVAGVLLGGVLGLASYYLVIVLPRGTSNVMRVVGTLGILVILQALVQLRYGPNPLVVDDFYPDDSLELGGDVAIPLSRVILVILAVVMTAGLAYIYSRTPFGLATTAAAENPRKLQALGWRIGLVGAVNWAVGGALAGFAGVLLAPITGVALTNGTALTVTVLAAALIGGLRSFPLTLAGGMVIGMLQSLFVVRDLGVDGLADAIPFAVIVAVIVFRGRSLPLRSHVGERLPSVGAGMLSLPTVAVAAAAAVILIGPVLNDNGTRALTTSLLAAILLMSFTVLLGFAGQMSLAQVTLAGVGGLIAARVFAEQGWPFALALVVGVLGAVPVGLLVGLPSARTRGVSLAIATLGLAVAIQSLVFDNDSISGGQFGIPLSLDGSFPIFGYDFGAFANPDRYAYLVLGFVVVVALAVVNLRRSSTGRRMIAVRSNERAAAGLGVNVVSMKLWAFGIASGIAAISGILTAFRGTAAIFNTQSVISNIVSIGYAVIGGVGSVIGALFGSLLEPAGAGQALLNLLLDVSPVTMSMIGGILLVLTIIGAPDGMAADPVRLVSKLLFRGEDDSVRTWLASGTDEAADAPAEAALVATDVEVRFGSVRAVGGVDLSVEPGQIVGVVGANGAGKTTLIDAITGFVGASGSIRLGGVDLSGATPHARARAGLGRSWQSLELIEDLTVLDNLRTASDQARWWSPLADLVWPRSTPPSAAVLRAIELLDLGDLLGSSPVELSTGQRKRVALARAIAAGPSVLLLDEPCSGLDQSERDEVAELVLLLARELRMGVLLVEHDVHLVRRLADRVVALDFGQVIARGTPDEALADPQVAAAFLGQSAEEAGFADAAESDVLTTAAPTGEVTP